MKKRRRRIRRAKRQAGPQDQDDDILLFENLVDQLDDEAIRDCIENGNCDIVIVSIQYIIIPTSLPAKK